MLTQSRFQNAVIGLALLMAFGQTSVIESFVVLVEGVLYWVVLKLQ